MEMNNGEGPASSRTEHVNRTTIERLRRGQLSADELLTATRHLAACADCAVVARETPGVERAARALRIAEFADEEHPDLERELFAYADGTLPREQHVAVEEHLTHCRICREDVADAVRTRRSMRRRPAYPWWFAAAAALGVVLIATLIWNRLAPVVAPHAITPIQSVAVLPLHNSGSGKSDDFLAIALADALTTQLRDVPALQVRPMSAVLASRKNATSLAVDSLIEGQFAVSGNIVTITWWLIDSRTGKNLWTGSITGPRDNLMTVVENVSAQTLLGLNERLGVQRAGNASAPRSLNPIAFEEYLKARAVNQSILPEKHAEEVAHLQRAIELDPQFAAAYADLSIALSLGQQRGFNDAAQAEHYAREAVRLDPNLATAHLALGRVLFPTNFRQALLECVAALRLNAKDSQTIAVLTSFFVATGDAQEADCLIAQLPDIEPNSQEWVTRGYWYVNLLNAAAARRAADDALATKSHELIGCDIAANAYLLEGDAAHAQKFAIRAATIAPASYIPASLEAMIAAFNGDHATALRQLQAYSGEASRNRWAAIRQAITYGRLGDRAQSLTWAKRAVQLGFRSWFLMKNHPWLRGMQDDPEFAATLQQMHADLETTMPAMRDVYQSICGPGMRNGIVAR